MKILFINKYDRTGGAAVASWRLSEGLHRFHSTENRFIVGIKRSGNSNVRAIASNNIELFLQRGVNVLMNKVGLQYQYIPYSRTRIIDYAKQFQPDVISLHNIHGGYFPIPLLRTLSKIAPIVWTLHDMWAFTANAAHTFGDDLWKTLQPGSNEHRNFPSIGLRTGKWLLRQKEKIYRDTNMTLVTPSRWLHHLAVQSPLFAGKQIVHIPNGIDLSLFKPSDKKPARVKFKIPDDAKVLFFSSEDLRRGDFKGGNLLTDILEQLHSRIAERLHVIIIGGGDISSMGRYPKFVVHRTGFVSDETAMVEIINTSDVLLYPSRADNLPNVLVESIACGVPAIAYDTGGCNEIIESNVNGFIVPQFDAGMFAERVVALLQNSTMADEFSLSARKTAEQKFDIASAAADYAALFSSLKKN